MRTTQPNFEIIKSAFYQNILYNTTVADCIVLMESIYIVNHNKFPKSFHKRREEFKVEFNKWLDSIDIRMAGKLIDILNERKISIPNWIRNKSFVIDYNNHNALDLIKLES